MAPDTCSCKILDMFGYAGHQRKGRSMFFSFPGPWKPFGAMQRVEAGICCSELVSLVTNILLGSTVMLLVSTHVQSASWLLESGKVK